MCVCCVSPSVCPCLSGLAFPIPYLALIQCHHTTSLAELRQLSQLYITITNRWWGRVKEIKEGNRNSFSDDAVGVMICWKVCHCHSMSIPLFSLICLRRGHLQSSNHVVFYKQQQFSGHHSVSRDTGCCQLSVILGFLWNRPLPSRHPPTGFTTAHGSRIIVLTIPNVTGSPAHSRLNSVTNLLGLTSTSKNQSLDSDLSSLVFLDGPVVPAQTAGYLTSR